MTLQEAIMDKDRPLSMTPQQWMQYTQANEIEQEQLLQNQVKRIVAVQQNNDDDLSQIQVQIQEKLDIGIEQMVLGCRIAIKSLQQLQRKNVSPVQRKVYNQIKALINNAIAPYLGDILDSRKGLYK